MGHHSVRAFANNFRLVGQVRRFCFHAGELLGCQAGDEQCAGTGRHEIACGRGLPSPQTAQGLYHTPTPPCCGCTIYTQTKVSLRGCKGTAIQSLACREFFELARINQVYVEQEAWQRRACAVYFSFSVDLLEGLGLN